VCSLLAVECIVVLLFLKESHIPPNSTLVQPPRLFSDAKSPAKDSSLPRDGREKGDETDAMIAPVSDGGNASPPTSSGLKNLFIEFFPTIGITGITFFCASANNQLLIGGVNEYVWSGTTLVSIAFQGLAFAKLAQLFGYVGYYRMGLLLHLFSWVYTPISLKSINKNPSPPLMTEVLFLCIAANYCA
jgi:hypothetical protein